MDDREGGLAFSILLSGKMGRISGQKEETNECKN